MDNIGFMSNLQLLFLIMCVEYYNRISEMVLSIIFTVTLNQSLMGSSKLFSLQVS